MSESHDQEQHADDQAAESLARWVETFNAGKLEPLVALYSDEAVLLGTSSAELYVGREQIRGYFRGGARVRIDRVVTKRLHGETVLCVGLYTFSREVDSRPAEVRARFTFLFAKENGTHSILHHHSSVLPAER